MRIIFVLITLFSLCSTFSFGQNVTDSIFIKKESDGYHYYQGKNKLSKNEYVTVLKSNEQAYKQYKSAQSTYTISRVFSLVGGALIGYRLGEALGGRNDDTWVLAGVGAGLIAVAIPLRISSSKKYGQSRKTYNSGLHANSFWNKSDLRFSMTGKGVGLTFKF
jgi:hypothetical protein